MGDDEDAQARAQAQAQRIAEDGRLWQHALHENTMLFQRGNLFLVGQSLFAVAYTTLLTSEQHVVAARVLAGFGLVLALTWLYVGHRHRLYYQHVQRRAVERLPEYATTWTSWATRRQGRSRGRSITLIAYLLPSLAVVMWAALLMIT
ncbi:RipA family octameric membrane protein [Streptomyces sp. SD11]|uniref:RipA family octameric membrane protein n=1 Tax=Streptomyces sp. SD11 TaxID=3452209 RepID=UPI003F89FAB7